MLAEGQLSCNHMFRYLTACSQRDFTGRIDITVAGAPGWHLYMHLGRLTWATGGIHPTRRWQRQLYLRTQGQLQTAPGNRPCERADCWDYYQLVELAQREQLQPKQIVTLMRGVLDEVLFDIVQVSQLILESQTGSFQPDGKTDRLTLGDSLFPSVEKGLSVQIHEGLRPSAQARLPYTWMQSVQVMQQRTQQAWKKWIDLGLGDHSPNHAPLLRDPEKLKAQASAQLYRNLSQLLNGRTPLRDLSVRLGRDYLNVAQALAPYLQQRQIEFVEVPDLPRKPASANPVATKVALKAAQRPLVAYVDDSQQSQQLVEAIAKTEGCRFLSLFSSIEALPTIVERKPDLIFLDLVMPIVNGYELCSQLRRIEALKPVPIVILTANLVDRVRARVAGATDCLSKPIETDKIRAVLRRYGVTTKPIS